MIRTVLSKVDRFVPQTVLVNDASVAAVSISSRNKTRYLRRAQLDRRANSLFHVTNGLEDATGCGIPHVGCG